MKVIEMIGDYRRFYLRRIKTDAKTYYERLRITVENLQDCIDKIQRATTENSLALLNGLAIEFEGRLEMVKDLKNKLEPLVTYVRVPILGRNGVTNLERL